MKKYSIYDMDAGYDYAFHGNYYETVREAVVAIHKMVWRELRYLVDEYV